MDTIEGDIFKESKSLSEVFQEFESVGFEGIQKLDLQNLDDKCPKPSKLRISTMTATCKTGLQVDLNIIYGYSEIQDLNSNKEGIIKIEFGDEKIRGTSKKDLDNKKTKKKKSIL